MTKLCGKSAMQLHYNEFEIKLTDNTIKTDDDFAYVWRFRFLLDAPQLACVLAVKKDIASAESGIDSEGIFSKALSNIMPAVHRAQKQITKAKKAKQKEVICDVSSSSNRVGINTLQALEDAF